MLLSFPGTDVTLDYQPGFSDAFLGDLLQVVLKKTSSHVSVFDDWMIIAPLLQFTELQLKCGRILELQNLFQGFNGDGTETEKQ